MKRTIVHLVVALCVVGSVRADQMVQSVQQALKDQGFYYGNVTGDNSAETTAAVRRYQIRNGLQVTGEINPETIRSLNLRSNSAASSQPTSKPATTPPKSVASGDSSQVERSWSPRSFGESNGVEMNRPLAAPYRSVPSRINGRIVAEVQHQLASRGYYLGRIDGRYGRRTAFAVGVFQWRSGISPTGRLDMTTLDALELSDWNVGYLESASQSYENWPPVKKFKHGKWQKKQEEEWKRHHRDDDGDEQGDDDEWGKWGNGDGREHGERAKAEAKYVEEWTKAQAKALEEEAKARAKWIEERAKGQPKWVEERAKADAKEIEEHGKARAKAIEERAKLHSRR